MNLAQVLTKNTIAGILEDIHEWVDESVVNYFLGEEFKEAANAVIRQTVTLALQEIGVDIGQDFPQAIIHSCHVLVEREGDSLKYGFAHNFEDREITTTWVNKHDIDESQPVREASIGSLELFNIFDKGRSAYTISGKYTKHKKLAISQHKGPYDYTDKSNRIVTHANIPALPASNFVMRAKAHLEAFIQDKWAEKNVEFHHAFTQILNNRLGAML